MLTFALLCDGQAQLMLDVYAEVLRERPFPYVKVVDFSWFPPECVQCGGVRNNGCVACARVGSTCMALCACRGRAEGPLSLSCAPNTSPPLVTTVGHRVPRRVQSTRMHTGLGGRTSP